MMLCKGLDLKNTILDGRFKENLSVTRRLIKIYIISLLPCKDAPAEKENGKYITVLAYKASSVAL